MIGVGVLGIGSRIYFNNILGHRHRHPTPNLHRFHVGIMTDFSRMLVWTPLM
jgi:hypothetical protein